MPGVCLVMKLLLLMLLTKTAKYKVQSLQSQIGSCHLKASLNFFLALCSRKFGANCFTHSLTQSVTFLCLSAWRCLSWFAAVGTPHQHQQQQSPKSKESALERTFGVISFIMWPCLAVGAKGEGERERELKREWNRENLIPIIISMLLLLQLGRAVLLWLPISIWCSSSTSSSSSRRTSSEQHWKGTTTINSNSSRHKTKWIEKQQQQFEWRRMLPVFLCVCWRKKKVCRDQKCSLKYNNNWRVVVDVWVSFGEWGQDFVPYFRAPFRGAEGFFFIYSQTRREQKLTNKVRQRF